MEVYVDDLLNKSLKDVDHVGDLKKTFDVLRKYSMKLNPKKCSFGLSSGKFLGFMVTKRGMEANPEKIRAIIEMQSPKNVKEMQQLTGKVVALNRFLSRSSDKCKKLFKSLKVSGPRRANSHSKN